MKIRLFNRVYAALAPVIGARAAIWFAEIFPVVLFAGIPLLFFWLFLSVPTTHTGADHQTCGAGAQTRDC
jgi:hypothetical protein